MSNKLYGISIYALVACYEFASEKMTPPLL